MNRVTLAAAGARKTQSIIDTCCTNTSGRRRLVVTYTLTGQNEIEDRLINSCSPGTAPEVMGWYSFLLRHWIKPFLPMQFPGRRLRGMNFDGEPARGRYATGVDRYIDGEDRAFKLHLSKLAVDIAKVSNGAVIDRLSRIYDEIYIDEVQDLTGCDLHVLETIMKSKIDLAMVGDIRQSVYSTNPRDPTFKKYRSLKMMDWFHTQSDNGTLEIQHSSETWRANQEIATFSDTIFPASLGFQPTISNQTEKSNHSGVFVLKPSHVNTYVTQFKPACLRPSKSIQTPENLVVTNFGVVKGVTYERVLIFPSDPIKKFLKTGAALAEQSACGLYVGVTRAVHSVAFVVEEPEATSLPVWLPTPRLVTHN